MDWMLCSTRVEVVDVRFYSFHIWGKRMASVSRVNVLYILLDVLHGVTPYTKYSLLSYKGFADIEKKGYAFCGDSGGFPFEVISVRCREMAFLISRRGWIYVSGLRNCS